MFRKKFLWRLYLSYLLITIAAIVFLAVYTSKSLRKFYHKQVLQSLRDQAELVIPQILADIKAENYKAVDEFCKRPGTENSTRISVILLSGRVIADSRKDVGQMENHSGRPEIINALSKGSGWSVRLSATLGEKMMYFAMPLKDAGKTIAVVRMAVSVAAIDTEFGRLYKKIVIATIFVVIFTAIVSLLLSKNLSRPIEIMKETARNFASGRLDVRTPAMNSSELSELSGSLNEMARQLNDRINIITQQRNELTAILSSMAEGVIAIDMQGHILTMNQAAADLLGTEPEKAKQHSIQELIRNIDMADFVGQTLSSDGKTETQIPMGTVESRFLKLYGSVLKNEKGYRSGAVIVLNDITRMKRLEIVRKDFVANVSHELKTPITSIKGFIETLQEGAVNSPQEAKRFLEIISRHADRLNSIIDDLLSLSRLEDGSEKQDIRLEKQPVRPVISAAIELSAARAAEKKITVNNNCGLDIQAIINSELMCQAIVNLIDNAVKYSPDDGLIEINACRDGGMVRISVSDNGCGIESQYLPRIFERFYVIDKARSRKLGGTGLGLSIVKHIAQVHSGSVEVKSDTGSGSTFTIKIPSE